MAKVVKRILRAVIYTLGGIVLLLALAAAFTQTALFRERLKATALSALDSALVANIRLGELSGNLVTGFTIDSVAIDVDGQSLLLIERATLRYNLLALFNNSISVHTIILEHPVINIRRSTTGEWNLSRMIRPSPPDTTQHGPFRWSIDLRRLEFRGGEFSLVDSLTSREAPGAAGRRPHIRYDNVTLRDLELALSARKNTDEVRVAITNLSCTIASPTFRVNHFSGEFWSTPTTTEVSDLRLITDSTHLALGAILDSLNLLGGVSLDQLRAAPVSVELQADKFGCGDLAYFLPAVDFLNGNLSARLVAGGKFDSVQVDGLYLKFGESNLALKGTVSNITAGDSLLLAIRMAESVIAPVDPRNLLPYFSLPDLQSLGPIHLDLEYRGHPTSFQTDFHIATEAGALSTDSLHLTIGGKHTLRYAGSITFRDVDLARVLDSPAWLSRLNGVLSLEGEGVGLDDIDAVGRAALDSSEFRRLPLLGSAVSVQAKNNRVDGTMNVALGDAYFGLEGGMDVQSTKDRTFRLRGDLRSLNLQTLLWDSAYSSDLNMHLNLQARGNTLRTIEGNLECDITDSRYRAYALDEAAIQINLSQGDSLHKELQITSPFVDLSLTGSFDLAYLTKLVAFEAQNLQGALSEKLSVLDSSLFSRLDQKSFETLRTELANHASSLNAVFDVTVKNLDPFPHLFRTRIFNGSGTLRGTIQGDHRDLQSSINLDLTEFYYGDVLSGVLIERAKCAFAVDGLKPTRHLEDFNARLDASVGMVDVSSREMEDIAVQLSIRQEEATFSTEATLDRYYRLEGVGSARVQRDTVVIEVERLMTAYRDFAWNADPGAIINLTRNGASLDKFTIQRGRESLRVRAALAAAGTLRGHIEGTALELDDLKYALEDGENGSDAGQIFRGRAGFSVDVAGTLETPVVTGSFRVDTISVRSIPFGTLLGDVGFQENALTLNARAYDASPGAGREPILTINGSIPVASSKASAEAVNDHEMNLTIHATGVNINILDPFLPTFDEMSGLLTCSLVLRGTPSEPYYLGTIALKDFQFLFEPNNITYVLNGQFEAVGQRIQVTQATIRNIPEDEESDRKGLVYLGGDFGMNGFTPGDFNLSATGKLLVVKESTRKSSLSVYGNLFVEIGPAGLHFTGEISRSLLKGDLFIRNSSLIFPPTQATVTDASPLSVPIVVYDDTSKLGEKAVLTAADRYFGNRQRTPGRSLFAPNIGGSVSFMDGLRYDLDIEAVGGNTEIRMIFNPISSEELVATIDGKFSIADDGTRWFGDLRVTRATYYFYRRFDAEGGIRYTGDFMDPQLDITARFKGVRAVSDSLRGDRRENVVVTVQISGSRSQPKLAMSMTIDDADYATYRGPKSNDEQSDAIGFIIYGSFPLSSAQRNEVPAEVQKTLGSSLLTGATSMLTGTLSEFLRTQTGFINSVELSFNASGSRSDAGAADLRLSGVAWSGYWRYGGQVFEDPLGNANFSLQYSLGTVFSTPTLRNLMIELERKVESGTFGQFNELRRTNSARLFYRFSF